MISDYQGNEIMQPLVAEISWSKHLVIMAKCKDLQERQLKIKVHSYGMQKPRVNTFSTKRECLTAFD